MNPTVITIDGPAASGKTSVSRELARSLGMNWLSTGSIYRALAFAVREAGIDPQNQEAISAIAKSRPFRVEMTDDCTRVFFGSRDVTPMLTSEDIGGLTSTISRHPMVRAELLELQRSYVQKVPKGLIAEGRDCGTVVFPKAQFKFFLTARGEARANRRALELGQAADQILAAQKVRDFQDSSRSSAPLAMANDAHLVETSELSLLEVVQHCLQLVKEGPATARR